MKISTSINQTFGRAFTTQELRSYDRVLSDARKELKLKDTEAIIFDFNVPSAKGENTAIGTTFSENSLKFVFPVSFIKLAPQLTCSDQFL